MHHLSWQAALDLAESAGTANALRSRHLQSCALCADRVRGARSLLDALELAGTRPPSDELMARTWARLREEIGAESPVTAADVPSEGRAGRGTRAREHVLRRIRAALVGDSWRPVLGVRGAVEASARVLVFETGEYGLSLVVSPGERGGTADLLGQILPRATSTVPPSGRALLRVGTASSEAEVSHLGDFFFRGVPTGDGHLAVILGDLRIQIPRFPLSGSAGTPAPGASGPEPAE